VCVCVCVILAPPQYIYIYIYIYICYIGSTSSSDSSHWPASGAVEYPPPHRAGRASDRTAGRGGVGGHALGGGSLPPGARQYHSDREALVSRSRSPLARSPSLSPSLHREDLLSDRGGRGSPKKEKQSLAQYAETLLAGLSKRMRTREGGQAAGGGGSRSGGGQRVFLRDVSSDDEKGPPPRKGFAMNNRKEERGEERNGKTTTKTNRQTEREAQPEAARHLQEEWGGRKGAGVGGGSRSRSGGGPSSPRSRSSGGRSVWWYDEGRAVREEREREAGGGGRGGGSRSGGEGEGEEEGGGADGWEVEDVEEQVRGVA
jgi:hypothetical protein